MEPQVLINILGVAETLKCTTRHCDTSSGRRESVAEHSWRLCLFALLVADEFPELNIDRVIKMCIIHDLGEAFTGDIATFDKTQEHIKKEDEKFFDWISSFPVYQKEEFMALLKEMNEMKTEEAKLYKALDKLEAVIQHNESDIKTWLPLEYELQLTYGTENVSFSPYLIRLKEFIDSQTKRKIKEEADEIHLV